MEQKRLCPFCMGELPPAATVCPHCGKILEGCNPAGCLPVGTVLVPGGGITMASCEQYHITVHGKGGHGSMPNACIDPITAAAHIHIALQLSLIHI